MIWMVSTVVFAGPPAVEAVKYQLPACEPLEDRHEDSRRLARLHAQDERDRTHRPEDDAERVAAVGELVSAGRVCSPSDHLHAAAVLQRGTAPEDQLLAHVFAFHALANGIRKAERLTAVTYDRWLVSRGLPQWYGTQTGTDAQGRACLIEIDPEARDAERIAVGLPTLTEIVPQMHEGSRAVAVNPAVNGLYCPAVPWDRAARSHAASLP